MVVDPWCSRRRSTSSGARRIDLRGLRVSANAHLIMPYHKLLDQAGEAKLGKLQIGTTRRGIGPCYADKAARLGIRMQDLLDEKILRKKIYAALEPKRLMLRPFAKAPQLDLHTMTEEYRTLGHRLEPYIADTPPIAWRTLDDGGLVVFEGAQGTLLDIDHGTYPFVTSSNPVAGCGLCGRRRRAPARSTRCGGSPRRTRTRVGAGPFPTELDDELGEQIREAGGEFGTTTGRARRTGWLDLVALKLRDARERPHRPRGHEARRAHRHRPAPRGGPLPRPRGRDLRRVPLPPVDPPQGARRLRRAAGLARGHPRLPLDRGAAARTRRTTSTSSATSSASRS